MAFFKSGLLRFVRYLTFLATVLIFADAIYRMFSFGTATDPYFFILTFYLIGFAVLLGVAEIRFKKIIVYIEFMRGRLGKGIYIVLVGLLIFDVSRIVELVFSCMLILIGMTNIVASCMRDSLKEDDDRRDLQEDAARRAKFFQEDKRESESADENTHITKYTTTEKRY